MQYLYYTVTGVFLYLISDWTLNRIEAYYGKRFQYRSVLFFVIIMALAVGSFELIDRVVGKPLPAPAQQDVVPAQQDTVAPQKE